MFSPGPEVIICFHAQTQLSIKFIMLINVIMPSIVDILTFISMIIQQLIDLPKKNLYLSIFFMTS